MFGRKCRAMPLDFVTAVKHVFQSFAELTTSINMELFKNLEKMYEYPDNLYLTWLT